jgi:hypothetical protein
MKCYKFLPWFDLSLVLITFEIHNVDIYFTINWTTLSVLHRMTERALVQNASPLRKDRQASGPAQT